MIHTDRMHCGGYHAENAPSDLPLPSPDLWPLLRSMQASHVPAETHGLWSVELRVVSGWMMLQPDRDQAIGTHLFRRTLGTLHHDSGELVMVDHAIELRTHLNFVLRARGNVLVTGLGLGCVVRGLVTHGRCDSVTVIERDPSVIMLVRPYIPDSVRVIKADALDWAKASDETFDYAWHDLWSDPDQEESHLGLIHSKLMVALKKRVRHQGAWKQPRFFKRLVGGF